MFSLYLLIHWLMPCKDVNIKGERQLGFCLTKRNRSLCCLSHKSSKNHCTTFLCVVSLLICHQLNSGAGRGLWGLLYHKG